ncbi:damage-inducible protein DinB [Pedobacter yulinensis]|uniref:Damage-inducible protein DinB n=1 Tax=Pedobacter yulinensis TaxID=2126353 RepID=A0A2T3HNQ0_9SPHI|nr:DinB family protein [Pedobacter yulinensis]PST84074.1 damage-inducible protein DinB [Pedobacter yulinensis]
MNIIDLLLTEMSHEATTTRKMLALVPAEKFDWAPHEKSMKLKNLSTHIAELPGWITMALTTDEIDFDQNSWKPTDVADNAALMQLFEDSLTSGRSTLEKATEEDLNGTWTLRSGDQIFNTWTKYETIRHAFCQTVHHRAQLGVYLRLLDIPIPGSYGPSADDPGM